MAVPDARVDSMQRIFLTGESRFIHVRGAHKTAIEPVAPAVVGTLDSPWQLSRTLGTHSRAKVPAYVVERARRAGLIAREDNAYSHHVPQDVVARFANLLGSSGAYPAFEVKLLNFATEDFRVGVIRSGESF